MGQTETQPHFRYDNKMGVFFRVGPCMQTLGSTRDALEHPAWLPAGTAERQRFPTASRPLLTKLRGCPATAPGHLTQNYKHVNE